VQDDKPHRTMGDIINKILISRGAPKEKYALRVPTVKLVRPEESKPLSRKQKIIIYDIEDSIKDIKNYNVLKREEIHRLLSDENSYYNQLRKEFFKDISHAIRAGLIWHPLVSDFIYTYKALGSKGILRKIRRGWETGIKRSLTINDLKFINRLEKIATYREEGETWEQIRRILIKGKIIKKMSWQALQKKFEKAWVEEWKKVNKKAPLIKVNKKAPLIP
jgi:hypothetical protein